MRNAQQKYLLPLPRSLATVCVVADMRQLYVKETKPADGDDSDRLVSPCTASITVLHRQIFNPNLLQSINHLGH